MSSTLRQLACAAWIALAACSGPDVASVVDQNSLEPAAPGALSPGAGAVSAGSTPGDVAPGGLAPGGGTPSATPPADPGPNGAPGGTLPPPDSMQAPASASGEQAQPSATETNFFTARCLKDSDCGETRRCEFPADAGSERAAAPDAGADAAPQEEPVPAGRCVAPSAS